MIQKFTYTRFMLLYILLYRITRSKFIGAVAFNTSLAVLFSFESLHIIDKHAVSLIKKECSHFPLCKINKNIFYIYDFLIHGSPFIYIILSPSFIKQNSQTLLHSSVVSSPAQLRSSASRFASSTASMVDVRILMSVRCPLSCRLRQTMCR